MSDELNPRTAVPRPVLLDDPKLDQIVRMVMALGAELSTVLIALDTVTRLLAQKGLVTPEELDAYVPTATVGAERAERLRTLVHNILQGLEAEFPNAHAGSEQSGMTP